MIGGGRPLKAMDEVVSRAVDRRLNTHVNLLLENGQGQSDGRTGRLMEETASGAAALLQRWPDQTRLLRASFARPLPGRLRQQAWALLLDSRSRTNECLQMMASRTTAKHDADIARRCDTLLQGPWYAAAHAEKDALVPLMRTSLSFWLAIKGTLRSSDIKMTAPLAWAYRKAGSGGHRVPQREREAAIAARFCRLLELSSAAPGSSAPEVCAAAMALLAAHDAELHAGLGALGAVPPDTVEVSTGEGGSGPFVALVALMLKPLFVEHLPLETVMFVWDCIVVALTAPGSQCTAFVLAGLLIGLRQELLVCEDLEAACTAFRTGASTLSVAQLQLSFTPSLLAAMQARLAEGDVREAPGAFDPALANPAWTSWLPADRSVEQARDAEEERAALAAEHEAAMERVRLLDAARLATLLRQQEELEQERTAGEARLEAERRRVAQLVAEREAASRALQEQRRLRQEMEGTLPTAGREDEGPGSGGGQPRASGRESKRAVVTAPVAGHRRESTRRDGAGTRQEAPPRLSATADARASQPSTRNTTAAASSPDEGRGVASQVDVHDAGSVLTAIISAAMDEVRALALRRGQADRPQDA